MVGRVWRRVGWQVPAPIGLVIIVAVAATASQAQTILPSVLPGLGPGATRATVDLGEAPWRGVVRVQTEVGQHCTGALVGARLVLTAAHCLFGRGTGRPVPPNTIHVLTAYDRGEYRAHARAVAVEIGAGFGLGPDGRRLAAAPLDADWAVLTLDAPIGTPDRLLTLALALPPAGTPAMLGGYEQDRAQRLIADVACRIIGTIQVGEALLLRHACAGTRGVSGAPVFVQGPEDRGWAVAGIASVARLGSAGGDAVPISIIIARSSALRSRQGHGLDLREDDLPNRKAEPVP